jgi:hypothetical protein
MSDSETKVHGVRLSEEERAKVEEERVSRARDDGSSLTFAAMMRRLIREAVGLDRKPRRVRR